MKSEEPKDQRSMPDLQHASSPYPTGEPPDGLSGLYQDHNTSPPLPTPESEAQGGSEEQRTKSLLAAYQQTFEVVEDLPAVVWVPWRAKGLRRIAKPLRSIYKGYRPHRISAWHSQYSLRHYWWHSHYEAWAM